MDSSSDCHRLEPAIHTPGVSCRYKMNDGRRKRVAGAPPKASAKNTRLQPTPSSLRYPSLRLLRVAGAQRSPDTARVAHSPTSATGTAWERTPWHATQRAAWDAIAI